MSLLISAESPKANWLLFEIAACVGMARRAFSLVHLRDSQHNMYTTETVRA